MGRELIENLTVNLAEAVANSNNKCNNKTTSARNSKMRGIALVMAKKVPAFIVFLRRRNNMTIVNNHDRFQQYFRK